jgi:hypothetical protein
LARLDLYPFTLPFSRDLCSISSSSGLIFTYHYKGDELVAILGGAEKRSIHGFKLALYERKRSTSKKSLEIAKCYVTIFE